MSSEPERPQHPSGKPIREPREVGLSIERIPAIGSIIPRLQKGNGYVEAIGFHAHICTDADELFEEDKKY